jgi:hypothetical protein
VYLDVIYHFGSSEKPRKFVSDVADFDAPPIFVQPEMLPKAKIANNMNM